MEKVIFCMVPMLLMSYCFQNPGFEEGEQHWGDGSNYAITADAHTGNNGAKLEYPGRYIQQGLNVLPNTNYTISTYVKGECVLGVELDGKRRERLVEDFGSYQKTSLGFNTGESDSVTVYARYEGSVVRLDDFGMIVFKKQKVDLNDWKLTFPVCNANGDTDPIDCNPYTAYNPTLASWDGDPSLIPPGLQPYISKNANGNWELRCRYTGITTSTQATSSRTEFREMAYASDNDLAAWTLSTGGLMVEKFRIAELEDNANKMIVAQIHGYVAPFLKISWEDSNNDGLGKLRLLRKIRDPGCVQDTCFYDDDGVDFNGIELQEWVTLSIAANETELTVEAVTADSTYTQTWTDHLVSDWNELPLYFKAGCYLQHHQPEDTVKAATVEMEYLSVWH